MQDIFLFMQNHWSLSLTVGLILVLLIILEFIKLKKGTGRITPAQAVQKMNHENAVMVDVRSPEAYAEGHVIGAISLPLAGLTDKTKKMDKYKNQPIVLICATGIDSQRAATLLTNQGFNVSILNGGIRAWKEAEMPVVKDK